MEHCVYWIRRPEHTDITTQGYVGITDNFDRRMKQHKSKYNNCNHLVNSIKKYGWDNLVKEVVAVSSIENVRSLEWLVRFKRDVGWNISIGGDTPPDTTGAIPWNKGMKGEYGWSLTEEQKQRHSDTNGMRKKIIVDNTCLLYTSPSPRDS